MATLKDLHDQHISKITASQDAYYNTVRVAGQKYATEVSDSLTELETALKARWEALWGASEPQPLQSKPAATPATSEPTSPAEARAQAAVATAVGVSADEQSHQGEYWDASTQTWVTAPQSTGTAEK